MSTASMKLIERPPADVGLKAHVGQVRNALSNISVDEFDRVVNMILNAYHDGRHVYVVGNGGSATTATHFACDLSKATIVDGRQRLRVTSLADNVALMTAWANDLSYDRVFAEQLVNLLSPGDILVAISASGNSRNILAAVETAHKCEALTVGLIGFSGGVLKALVDAAIHIPVDDYGVVEDCHLVVEHAITESVRARIAPE